MSLSENRRFPYSVRMDRARIFYSDFTDSLIVEAFRAGLLDRDEKERLKNEMAELLRENIHRFSSASSSVSEDTGNEMIGSVLFCLDACLMRFNPEKALSLLVDHPLSSLYFSGVRLVRSYVYKCAGLRLKIGMIGDSFPSPLFQDTIRSKVRSILTHYDIFFKAQKLPAYPEYRTLLTPDRLSGILFLLRYLQNLFCETVFCARFSQNETQHFFHSFSGGEVNFYYPALGNALASVLGGKKEPTLIPSEKVLSKASSGVRKRSEKERIKAISDAAAFISKDHVPFVKGYIVRSTEKYASSLIEAIRNGDPSSVRMIES